LVSSSRVFRSIFCAHFSSPLVAHFPRFSCNIKHHNLALISRM
jgi:hypothetical protein